MLKMCINTQTPLVWFTGTQPCKTGQQDAPLDLSELTEGVDYNYSSVGVTSMVFPLIKHMMSNGTVSEAHWVALNQSGPATIRIGGITNHFVSLAKDQLASYGNVKETMWRAAHGTTTNTKEAEGIFMSDDFPEYTYYNRLTAETIRELDREKDFDLFYIHDFQQLPIGHMLSTLKPKVYRWHTPFDESMIPAKWKELLINYFNSYDLIIVSADRYLSSLKSFGYTGKARKIYPYIDSSEYSRPTAEEIQETAKGLGIGPEDTVVLVVARMDPMKGQDKAIKAFASIANRYPGLKLILIGNGSFSSSKNGLGLSKAEKWRLELEELSKSLGVRERVVLAGHLQQKALDAMYERSAFTVLPSVREGFGLVVIESWLHNRACLVTERAGVAELVKEGENGMLFNPDNPEALADKMSIMLNDSELSCRLGESGNKTARLCSMDEGLKSETKVIKELIGG